MASKRKKRLFSGMSYREVQRSNSSRRSQLPRPDQTWLKENGYKNVGWDDVVKLYQKIDELLSSDHSDIPTLEDLFLKAESIGNKYQTSDEIKAFNEALGTTVEEISDEIDKQFPDQEFEYVDYSQTPQRPARTPAARKRRH